MSLQAPLSQPTYTLSSTYKHKNPPIHYILWGPVSAVVGANDDDDDETLLENTNTYTLSLLYAHLCLAA